MFAQLGVLSIMPVDTVAQVVQSVPPSLTLDRLSRLNLRDLPRPHINWTDLRSRLTQQRVPRPNWEKIAANVSGFSSHLPSFSLPKVRWEVPKMPAVRGRGGLCGCFKSDEPPEISYCVVDQGGLQAITPTQPMPSEEELEAKFAELVEELDLTAPNKAAMLSLPPEKKWQIYCTQRKIGPDDSGDTTDLSKVPEHYLEKLNAMSMLRFPHDNPDEVAQRTSFLDCLKTALRTQPNSFVTGFIELDGLPAILNFLTDMDYQTAESSIHTALIGCLKALMNNSNGRAHVLAHPSSINTIAQSLSTYNVKTKVSVLEILGAVCLVPGGHKKVLEAMLHFQEFAAERTRFQTIITDLDRSTGVYRDEVGLKTAIMSFINAVLNYGPGEDHLEFRVHLRYELLMLGIQPIIDKLRRHENETLDRHLDFFEMVRNEDDKELSRRFEQVHVDTKSASGMFELIRKKLNHSAAFPHFLSLLQHFLLLPLEYGSHPQHWLLFDRITQQLVLQGETGTNPDVAPLSINVKEIVQLLATEEELVAARTRAEELETENTELVTRLSKKEQELDLRTQEKEDLESSLERTKEKLEKESLGHTEARQKVAELEYQLSESQQQLWQSDQERQRYEQLLSGGSIPDDAKVGLQKKAMEARTPPAVLPPAAPPPPPPAPMPPPPPGPPPPPLNGLGPQPLPTVKPVKKNIPQPSNPLKSFNWSKLPDAKVSGTVWADLDDTKLYSVLDLGEVDRLFSAYQKNGVIMNGSVEDLGTLSRNKSKVLSVIDSRRAQNCTILLSKLKMTNEEIIKTLLSMDASDQLPIDMLEQMLKFTPSNEERALLDDHADDIDHLARADRFLYEISKIPHYEQRLRCLHCKKKFSTWVAECKPKVKAVLEASKEIQRSKRLKKLLEVVLAFGNYMNRGQRGNALGFKLSSLNRIADTKSSSNKSMTLLHFLVDTLERQFKDTLKIEDDLPHVKEAAKVNVGELEKDVNQLRSGLREVEKELEFHRTQPVSTGDRFIPVMKDFLATATYKLSELEDNFSDMRARFDRACRLFGEGSSSTQPDVFFGIFDTFISSMKESRQDMENIKKKKEEEERRAKQEAELRKRTIERRTSREGILSRVSNGVGLKMGGPEDKGEFDDLISALRTGDVFHDDMSKLKRNRKRANGTSPPRANSYNREGSRERVIND